jgi:hypothetical protein
MATYNLLGFDSTNNLPILPSSADTANVQGNFTVAGDQIVTGARRRQLTAKSLQLTIKYTLTAVTRTPVPQKMPA